MTRETRAIMNHLCLRIVAALRNGPRRFNDLERAVGAPHPPALSSRLKRMARGGLGGRTVIETGPPAHVEYALTSLGRDLLKPASGLLDWVAHNGETIRFAREQYHAS